MHSLGITHSTCGTCRAIVPAKVVSDGGAVRFLTFCPQHGEREEYVYRDVESYLAAQRYVKPAWVPRAFAGDAAKPCPEGCGLCARHEQHLCMPIVEITTRCDLACPACLVDAGTPWDMRREEFRTALDAVVRAEGQVDVLNLSGGEPLVHPELLAFVDDALARPEVVRVSVSTNGLRLLAEPGLAAELARRNVVVSLQLDGFDDAAYRVLRGRPLVREKRAILELLARENVTTSLTMTAAGGVNEHEFGALLACLFERPHVVSLMVQPLAFAGRGRKLEGRARRLSIPEVIAALDAAGHPHVHARDFVALPCSHPLCFSLAFYLMIEGGAVAVNSLVHADTLLDSLANRTVFGLDREEHERLKSLIYALWSGPCACAPDGTKVLGTLRAILKELGAARFDPRTAFAAAERRVKSIFIHAFQDAATFDLSRARRCCNAYVQPDGTLLPVCVRNCARRPA